MYVSRSIFSFLADAFGVTEAYMDQELCRFIASGRLHAKIDKVGVPKCNGEFLRENHRLDQHSTYIHSKTTVSCND